MTRTSKPYPTPYARASWWVVALRAPHLLPMTKDGVHVIPGGSRVYAPGTDDRPYAVAATHATGMMTAARLKCLDYVIWSSVRWHYSSRESHYRDVRRNTLCMDLVEGVSWSALREHQLNLYAQMLHQQWCHINGRAG